MSILFYKSFLLDIVNGENTDSDSASTETSSQKSHSRQAFQLSGFIWFRSKSMEAITFSSKMIKKYEKCLEMDTISL